MKPDRKTALVSLKLVWTCPSCGHVGTVHKDWNNREGVCPLCGRISPYDCSQLKSKLKTILEKLP